MTKKVKPHDDAVVESAEHNAKMWAAIDEHLIGRVELLRAEFAKSRFGVALLGAEVVELTGNSQRIRVGNGRLVGWSLCETTGAAGAKVYLRDGPDAGGSIVAVITLAAGESTRDSFVVSGLSFGNGLFVHVVSGAVEGAVYLGAVD